ncbi:hypothetical protein OG863_01310 [Streptomyces decoyicus]|uniref:Uncharacterized protein n=1 Tax=Streptomyces decoyicus TaxID=249567 RepID=A0ABZ1F8S5_9ACTN|nr:hypothetical protein [Streptomyces decoyicus]WSB66714.1 hypothetical protein OG863_01310 [Streptomyces decoyicus]
MEPLHHPANPVSGRDLAQAGFPRTGTSDRPAEDETALPSQVYALQNP